MRRPVAVLAGAVVVLAGCTASAVHSDGTRTLGSPLRSSTSGSDAASASGSSPTGAALSTGSASVGPPPSEIARVPVRTAIGDPVTADLCAAVRLVSPRKLGGGLTPSFDPTQYPPGCSVTVRAGAKSVVQFSVFADRSRPTAAAGRTTRTVSGLTIYTYRFDAARGSCERDVAAHGVRLVVDSFTSGSTTPPKELACAGTDAIAGRLAAAVAAGTVPRLPLATPSLAALDACKIARNAALTSMPTLAGGTLVPTGFGAGCRVRSAKSYLFFNFALADAPATASPTTVAGHRLFETVAGGGYCTFVANESGTADGRREQMTASAAVLGAAVAPAGMCAQAAQALARYLSAAGLS